VERITFTKEELKAAELAFCHVVMGLKQKPKKGRMSHAHTKWLRADKQREERFSAPRNSPDRRSQSYVAIYRHWREEMPFVLEGIRDAAANDAKQAQKNRDEYDRSLSSVRVSVAYPRPKSKPVEKKKETKSRAWEGKRGRFYKSWDWRTLRMKVLKERGARCECCGVTPADTDMSGKPVKICVDHIKPLARYWHLRLEKTNLQILCDECNQGKGAWDETDWRADNDDGLLSAIREQLRPRA
jgi:5-methylcytosine-specific restriction endonuclease McrA